VSFKCGSREIHQTGVNSQCRSERKSYRVRMLRANMGHFDVRRFTRGRVCICMKRAKGIGKENPGPRFTMPGAGNRSTIQWLYAEAQGTSSCIQISQQLIKDAESFGGVCNALRIARGKSCYYCRPPSAPLCMYIPPLLQPILPTASKPGVVGA
jgi:hypothetical protein